MNKYEFYVKLRAALEYNGYDAQYVEKTIDYYKEIVEDRMEDGASEAEAVASVGSVKSIVAAVRAENDPAEKTGKKEMTSLQKTGAETVKTLITIGQVLFDIIWYVLVFSFGVTAISLAAAGIGGLFISFVQLFMAGFATFLIWLGTSFVGFGGGVLLGYLVILMVRLGKSLNKFLTIYKRTH